MKIQLILAILKIKSYFVQDSLGRTSIDPSLRTVCNHTKNANFNLATMSKLAIMANVKFLLKWFNNILAARWTSDRLSRGNSKEVYASSNCSNRNSNCEVGAIILNLKKVLLQY